MRVLVTGATGCVGGALARRLAESGIATTASGRNRALGANLANAGVRFEAAELAHGPEVERIVAGHDVVVHCGGLSSAWGRAADFRATNVDGTRYVVAACERCGVRRLVFLSTPSLYFDFTDRLDITEDAQLAARPVNPYAASKLAAEQIVADAVRRGLDAVVVRPRAIFGPGDTALLPRLLRVARRGRLPLIDGGRAVIDLTYVDNVVDALAILVTTSTPLRGKIFNVTNGEPDTVARLFRRIVDALGIRVKLVSVPFTLAYGSAAALEAAAFMMPGRPEPLLTRYTVGVLGRSQTLSIAAARHELGYNPRVSIAEGIDRVARLWRAAHA